MNRPPLSQLHGYLRNVTDKRRAGKVLHKLEDILFIAVVATIANASCWEEVADFAKTRVNWLRQYIELPEGAPSHDTFERTFKWIDGKQFERCFILWMREVCLSCHSNRRQNDARERRQGIKQASAAYRQCLDK